MLVQQWYHSLQLASWWIPEPAFFAGLVSFPLEKKNGSFNLQKNHVLGTCVASLLTLPLALIYILYIYMFTLPTRLPIPYLKVQWWIPQLENGLHWLFKSNTICSQSQYLAIVKWHCTQKLNGEVETETVTNGASQSVSMCLDVFWTNQSELVGGIPTPLKNMSSSVGMMTFPSRWKNNPNVPNHQPVGVFINPNLDRIHHGHANHRHLCSKNRHSVRVRSIKHHNHNLG